jgi:type I restriction enzyme R subunit
MNESTLETAALEWLEDLGYAILHGPDIAPGEPGQERESFHAVLLAQRLREAIDRLNPGIPAGAREDAFRRIAIPDRPTLIANNRAFHQRLRDERRG